MKTIDEIEEQIDQLREQVEQLKKKNTKETIYYDYVRIAWYEDKDKWRVQLRKDGKHIGYFADLESAKEIAELINDIIKHLFGG